MKMTNLSILECAIFMVEKAGLTFLSCRMFIIISKLIYNPICECNLGRHSRSTFEV
jgi:hypothetical protein